MDESHFANHQNFDFQNTSENDYGIIFIDKRLHGFNQFNIGRSPNVQVFTLDPRQDGMIQLSHILSDWMGLVSLHLIVPGTPGCLQLGTATLSVETIHQYNRQLKSWTNALSQDANIFICSSIVAQGGAGLALAQKLIQVVDTNVMFLPDFYLT